jgi:DHA1 family multidrug resistance protein-like MFS transporter
MTSGFKIMLRGSLLGSIISRLTNGRVLGHRCSIENTDPRYFSANDSSSSDKESNSLNELIVVDFDGPLDLENPHNWPLWVKVFTAFSIALLTFFVYVSSVIYVPSEQYLREEFNLTQTEAILPLTLFVIAYGFGPLIFSPLSEHPAIGRGLTYIIPLAVFVILQIPTALVHNFAGFLVLRFLSGLTISSVLATGGASFADIFDIPYLPIAMCNWGVGAVSGASFGPLFGSALVVSTEGWRWSIWALLIIGSFILTLFVVLVPETYSKAILYRKALRLKKVTGNENIVVDEDQNSHKFSKETLKEILWRPIVIGVTEPVVLMINLYLGVLYAIIYLWFEAFPILFHEVKGFSVMALGVSYMSTMIGVVIGSVIYGFMVYSSFTKPLLRGDPLTPEVFTPVAMVGSILLPIGILIAGWTGTKDIHWIVPLIGFAIVGISAIILFQALLNYIAMSFPRYVASAFSSNAFTRSVFAGCFPLFGIQLFSNLSTNRFPIAWGATILAGISVGLIAITVAFYFYGPRMRAKSRYAGEGKTQ